MKDFFIRARFCELGIVRELDFFHRVDLFNRKDFLSWTRFQSKVKIVSWVSAAVPSQVIGLVKLSVSAARFSKIKLSQ